MSKILSGARFEKWFQNDLKRMGYWALRIPTGADGSQPADIIAVRDGHAMLVDCKVVGNKSGRFPFTRVEENQKLAYIKWARTGNGCDTYYFAMLWEDKVYMIPQGKIIELENQGKKSLHLVDMGEKYFWCNYDY